MPTSALDKLRRHWFNKRKSVTALLREVMYNQPRPAPRQRRRQQGGRRRSRAAVARRRSCRLWLSDHDDHGFRHEPRARRRKGPGGRARRQRPRLHLHPGRRSTRSRHGCRACLDMFMPMSASRSSTRSISRISCRSRRSGQGHRTMGILSGPPLLTAQTSGTTPFRLSSHVGDVGHMFVVGPDGCRQVGPAGAAGAAVPPLSGRADQDLRQGEFGACRGPRDGRHAPCSGHARFDPGRGAAALLPASRARSTIRPSAPGRRNGSSALLEHETGRDHA